MDEDYSDLLAEAKAARNEFIRSGRRRNEVFKKLGHTLMALFWTSFYFFVTFKATEPYIEMLKNGESNILGTMIENHGQALTFGVLIIMPLLGLYLATFVVRGIKQSLKLMSLKIQDI